jgi:N-acetylmuramoyl-L-alanine amidase
VARNNKGINRPLGETGFARRNAELFSEMHQNYKRQHGLYWATVEDDYDPQKQGRVKVHIPQLSYGTPEPAGKKDEQFDPGLIWCYPMTPSFGTTDSIGSEDGFSNSYGFWGPQPRKGDVVVVAFVNGTMPIWLGCLPKPRKNFMVPGVPGAEVEGQDNPVPATEKSPLTNDPRRVFNELNDRIQTAGLGNDRIRGIGTSGSTRESPSRVAGILTPGHPKDGVPGHSFIMDDLPEQQGVRLRTSRGHQITFSDVSDSIYIATGQGNAWVEISDDGKIDVYSKDSVSIHTEADLNVRADGDYLLDVAGDFYHKVGGDYKLEVAGNTDQVFAGYLKANVAENYEIGVDKNFKIAAKKKIQAVSTQDMSLGSKAKMLIYGTGDVGIDSGSTVKMEQGVASLPSYSSSMTSISSTLGSVSGTVADVPALANTANITSLVSNVDPGAVTGALSSMGSLAQANNIPINDLGGITAAMANNGIDIGSVPSQVTGIVNTLNNVSSVPANLSIIENLGLTASDVDISTLGLPTVLETLRSSGLSPTNATTLFGSSVGDAFSDIASQASALSNVTGGFNAVDFTAFRDRANGLNSQILSNNLSDAQVTAMASSLSRFTGPRNDVRTAIDRFTSALESPSASTLEVLSRANINAEDVTLTDSNFESVLTKLKDSYITPSTARALFGREHGPAILNMINDQSKISNIVSGFNTLDASALSSVNAGTLTGIGDALSQATGVVGNVSLSEFDLSGLNLTQVTDILNGAGLGNLPLSDINLGELSGLLGDTDITNLNVSDLGGVLSDLNIGDTALGSLNLGDLSNNLNGLNVGQLSTAGVDLSALGVNGLDGVLDDQLSGAANAGSIPTTSLPGPPTSAQAQAGTAGSSQQYIARRVPQHEPWKPDGRIVPEAVATSESGQKSTSDRGVTSATDRRAKPTGGTVTDDDPVSELTDDRIEYLVVHCSATSANSGANASSIERYHTISNRWSRIGYHYVIERNGAIINTLPETTPGIHVGVQNVNARSIAICVVGGAEPDSDGRMRPNANFTDAQLTALRTLLNELEGRYPAADLKGHRDFNAYYPAARRKACPSFDIQTWKRTGRITKVEPDPIANPDPIS